MPRLKLALLLSGLAAAAWAASVHAESTVPQVPPRVCVQRSVEGIEATEHPLSVLVGPNRTTLSERGRVAEGKTICFNADRKDLLFVLRMSDQGDATVPSTEFCSSSLPGTPHAGATFTAILQRQRGVTAGRCPWFIGFGIDDPSAPSLLAKMDFVVLPSVRSYRQARAIAELAASQLSLRLNLRGALPDGRGGLTFSKRECAANDWDYPCYVTRGRSGDGLYVSIDDAAMLLSPTGKGYVVVLASGPAGDRAMRALVERARDPFPAISITTQDVYQGCIH